MALALSEGHFIYFIAMEVVLKDKSTSVVPEYTTIIVPRIYPTIKNGAPAQMRLYYKLYYRNGELYALENSNRCTIERNTDCWEYFHRRCSTLQKGKDYAIQNN